MNNPNTSQSASPTRTQTDLADVVELLLDKGIVVNADIAVSIGDTELLGIQLRAAIASFETAAAYGLEFPAGTDMERVAAASGQDAIETHPSRGNRERNDDRGPEKRDSDGGDHIMSLHEPPISDHSPSMTSPPITEDSAGADGNDGTEHESDGTEPDDETESGEVGPEDGRQR